MPGDPPTDPIDLSSTDPSEYAPEPTSDEPTGRSTAEAVLGEVLLVVRPVVVAANRGGDELYALLENAGIARDLVDESGFREFESAATAVADVLGDVDSLVEDGAEVEEVDSLIESVGDAFGELRALRDVEVDVPGVDSLGERLVDHLLTGYLGEHHPQVYSALSLFGVVTVRDDGTDDIDLSVLSDLPADAGEIPAAALEWGSESFDAVTVVYYLRQLAWSGGFPAVLQHSNPDELDALVDVDEYVEEQELRLPILTVEHGEVGVRIVPLPGKEGSKLPGIAVVPYGTGAIDLGETIDFGDSWTFNVESTGEGALDGTGLAVRPESGGLDAAMVDLNDGTRTASLSMLAEAALRFDGSTEEREETTLLGDPDGSRLALRSVSAEATVEYDTGDVVVTVALPATGTLGVHPDDFDGFLGDVLPGDGIFYDFEVTVGWSSKHGLFFERGGTLEASIPQNVDFGPFNLGEIYLGALQPAGDGADAGNADAGSAPFSLTGAATGDIELGPIAGTITRMGVTADVTFPENADGNLGIVDLDVGFKPPEGIGLSVDAGAVTGGGYLEFDEANERYAGVLQLQAGTLSINAIGLLTTELPGGRDGFSLLVLIAGEFSPVQLGFGFTLNGVGGLLGVNRSVKTRPLGDAVRTGNLNAVLFPQNPVANAQRIVSDLRSVFPPTAGSHVFGPMAKLGWGTPTLVTADLGIVLELPSGKFVLVGALHATLPDEAAPLVELHMAASGYLDPGGQRAGIDASLYDSRIAAWTVSGDMAMRSNWGDDPRFVLAIGGFNPRFEPPEDFPELDRVRASLGAPGGNPKLELTGYFALTSNTVQAGAGLHLRASAGPAKVEGKLAFDALLQFDPFKFVVDILAKLSVKIKGKGLTLKLDGTLSGPSPWRVKGSLRIEILFFSITVHVNVSIGSSADREELPPARLFPKLLAELEKPGNWTAQVPDGGDPLVTLREIETGDDEVLAHPLGTIGVRQTVVPLAYEIERFGNAKPTGYTQFEIESTSGGVELGAETTEQFAPAQYRKLSDSEKLHSPAFERHAAGRKLSQPGIYPGYADASERADNVVSTRLGYECSVVDRTKGNWGTPLAELGRFRAEGLNATSSLAPSVTDALLEAGAVARAPIRTTGPRRFSLSESGRVQLAAAAEGLAAEFAVDRDPVGSEPDAVSGTVAVAEPTYTVVRADDMTDTSIVEGAVSKADAVRTLSKHVSENPGAAGAYQVVESHRARGPSTSARGGVTAVADGGSDDANGDDANDDGASDDGVGGGSGGRYRIGRPGDARGPEVYL